MNLVSIITPTTESRERFLQMLQYDINQQTYPEIEWLVDASPDLSIGEKRNRLCARANGQYIAHFDDDDHYDPAYLAAAVHHLETTGADVTGLCAAYFVGDNQYWEYQYTGRQPYVIGSGMLYRRSAWEQNPFKDMSEGEDMHFLANAGRIEPFDGKNLFYARIHGANTCSHKSISTFKSVDYRTLVKIFPHLL